MVFLPFQKFLEYSADIHQGHGRLPPAAWGGVGWSSQLLVGVALGKEQVGGCCSGAMGETWLCQE